MTYSTLNGNGKKYQFRTVEMIRRVEERPDNFYDFFNQKKKIGLQMCLIFAE